MTVLSSYTPQIGEKFDSFYNTKNQSGRNVSVFEDNEYLQGNVTATFPQQIGEDHNSWSYTWGAVDEQGEYTTSLDRLTFEEADTDMQNEIADNDDSSLLAEDQLEIMKLLSEYDIAIDNGDIQGTVDSFTTDGELIAVTGTGKGEEGLAQFHQELFDSGFDTGKRHLTGNIILDGDSGTGTATGFSYLVVFESQDKPGVISTATQTDTYRKENGEWKIQSREIDPDPGFLEEDVNGDDLILGTSEHDTLNGFQGNDRIFGLTSDDLIFGGEGDDLLQGDAGSDQLFGNTGRDILSGGQNVDSLTGGKDSDIFIVQSQDIGSEENYDVIKDFELETDVLALDEIKFGQLSILQEGNNTSIQDARNNELLSVLTDTQASEITADVFIDWV